LTPRIVLASMHAPSARLLSHVTHLLVLAWNGQMAYFGKRDQVSRPATHCAHSWDQHA
jgi:hypothetical protein